MHPQQWLANTKEGLYCIPGDFYINPIEKVKTAFITDANAGSVCPKPEKLLAHTNTIALMLLQFDKFFAGEIHGLGYYERRRIKDVECYLLPAGYILGSAQIVIGYQGTRFIISGHYKRVLDPTCLPFEVESCDVFITEATFSLPIFKHPPIETEINKLLASLRSLPHRCHLVGISALGTCQRVIRTLRLMGYLEPVYIHDSLKKLCDFYSAMNVDLGEVRVASTLNFKDSPGKIVLCPPHVLRDKWNRRLADVVISMASGWMQTRARAKQQGVELPLIISDHADWFELIKTIREINPSEVWITKGQHLALTYYLEQSGFKVQTLDLLNYRSRKE